MSSGRTDKGLWALVAGLAGWCLVTMVIVPVLALTTGAYLGATGRYLAAIAVVAAAGAMGWWLYHRRARHDPQGQARAPAHADGTSGRDHKPPSGRTRKPSRSRRG